MLFYQKTQCVFKHHLTSNALILIISQNQMRFWFSIAKLNTFFSSFCNFFYRTIKCVFAFLSKTQWVFKHHLTYKAFIFILSQNQMRFCISIAKLNRFLSSFCNFFYRKTKYVFDFLSKNPKRFWTSLNFQCFYIDSIAKSNAFLYFYL